MPTLGQLIKDCRQKKGLTVRGFAATIGVQPPFVTDIEADRRRPGPEVLSKIAETLDLPLEQLQALDPRISPEVKQWMDTEPRVSSLLRQLRQSANPDELLRRVEEVVQKEHNEGDEEKEEGET